MIWLSKYDKRRAENVVRKTNPVKDDESYSPKDGHGGEEILMQAWKEVFIRICQRHEQSSRSEGGIYKASAMKPLAPAAAFE